MIKRVAIIGGHIQALGLVRQVARLGIEAILLVDSIWAVARFSRYVSHVYKYSNNEELMQILQKLYLLDKSTLIFPTNDESVEFLSNNYATLSELFAMGIPNPQLVTLFNDKRKAYQYVTAEGIPCPKCWYPNNIEDVTKLAQKLPYPIVVKPAIMYSFHTTFGKKAYRCDNAEQLLSIFNRIKEANYPIETILIQEFLSGGPQYLYSYGVFAANGQSRAALIANRIRQNPMDFGNSTTFAQTCHVPQIEEQSIKLLQLVNYFGLGEVEWMYDPQSGTYKFLEINTRAWKWHTISNQLGFSFIGAMIDYYNDKDTTPILSNEIVGWVERLTDWTVVTKECLKRRMHLKDVCPTYKLPKENAVWQWSDPLPGIMYVILSPILYIKRH